MDYFSKPDFIILLKASFDVIEERMAKRNRKEEIETDVHYWQDLYYRYYAKKSHRDRFIKYSENFVEIDANEDDPNEVANKIIKYIDNKYKK